MGHYPNLRLLTYAVGSVLVLYGCGGGSGSSGSTKMSYVIPAATEADVNAISLEGVSSDGTYIAGAERIDRYYPTIWKHGIGTRIVASAPFPLYTATATAVSDDGTMIAGTYTSDNETETLQAFFYSDKTGYIKIPLSSTTTQPGLSEPMPYKIDSNGDVSIKGFAYIEYVPWKFQTCYWSSKTEKNSSITYTPPVSRVDKVPPGYQISQLADASFSGAYSTGTFGKTPVSNGTLTDIKPAIWDENGNITVISNLPGTVAGSNVTYNVSETGRVVGGGSLPDKFPLCFVWSQGKSPLDLTTILNQAGLQFTAESVQAQIDGISSNGRFIIVRLVGEGQSKPEELVINLGE